MTAEDIELLFKSRSSQLAEDGGITAQEKDFRVNKLQDILGDIRQIKASDPDELEFVAEKLGDGARDGKLPLRSLCRAIC